MVLSCLLFIAGFFTACDDGNNDETDDLIQYQKLGASVAAKSWSEDYDCSNFSVQFYQNCFNAGLPCRVRNGDSGGQGFDIGRHAWNSVLINAQWVDWEPQYNGIHFGHIKTSTLIGGNWGSYTKEDITRVLYELVGRNVPASIIDTHEIDKYLWEDSPFNPYFNSFAYCVNDDPDSDYYVGRFQSELPNNGDGDM